MPVCACNHALVVNSRSPVVMFRIIVEKCQRAVHIGYSAKRRYTHSPNRDHRNDPDKLKKARLGLTCGGRAVGKPFQTLMQPIVHRRAAKLPELAGFWIAAGAKF